MKIPTLILAALWAGAVAAAPELQRGPGNSAPSVPASPVAFGAGMLTQMSDSTPVANGGVSCSDYQNAFTFNTSWWRRFYLAEHGSPSSVMVDGVSFGVETGFTPMRVRLWSLPSATPVDTVATAQLRLLGESAPQMVGAPMDASTIAVNGLLADAVGHDLVVEVTTDGNMESAFYLGANASAETHPSFISAPDCGVYLPQTVGTLGFPDAHLIIAAHTAAAGVQIGAQFAPARIGAGQTSRLELVLANALATNATLTAPLSVALPGGLTIATPANAATTCGGSAVAPAAGTSLGLNGGAVPALGMCTVSVDVTSPGGHHDLRVEAGALQTSQGGNTYPAGASLTVIPAGGNGLVRSGDVSRTVAATPVGSSYNMVTNEFQEGGRLGRGWDINFNLTQNFSSPYMFTLGFNTARDAEMLLDGNGEVALLGNGDVVGPTGNFTTGMSLAPNPAWLAQADGAVGVRFRCADRLTYPVLGGDYCYGYVRLVTRAPTGLVAQIIESAYQGDGEPITVLLPSASAPPSASVTPALINLSVPANAVSWQEFRLHNAPGSQPLRYASSGRGVALAARPDPLDLARPDSVTAAATRRTPFQVKGPLRIEAVEAHDPTPWTAPGGFLYALDDGAMEFAMGLGTEAAIWLNRFSVLEAQTINSISAFWPAQTEGGSVRGLEVNLLAYYDADGDGDPTNAVRLGADQIVTIDKIGAYQTYPTQFAVPGAGDIYIGYVDHWARNSYPFPLFGTALDTTSYVAASYISGNMPDGSGPANPDINNLGANQFSVPLGLMGIAGNVMVRASGDGPSCTGAAIPWLAVDGKVGRIVGGGSAHLRFKVDPAAGNLSPGTHGAELCIVTNDPARPVMGVPVSVQVTAPAPAHSCSPTGDSLFCEGFEDRTSDPIVRSGLLDVSMPATSEGLSFNFSRNDWSEFPLGGDDYVAFQSSMLPFMLFYWHSDLTPGLGGGVADTVFGPYKVLQSGATIGPDSVFSEVASARYAETRRFLEGVDGYLGFRFFNEATRQVNYGYMHLQTTWPSGYPARMVGYAYNREGGPITIP